MGTVVDSEATTEEEELKVTAIDSDTVTVEELRTTEEKLMVTLTQRRPLMRS